MTKITLARPVEHDGKTYDAIEIDEPTFGGVEAFEDASRAGRGEIGASIAMLAVDTGWPEAALRKIRAGDMRKITEALAPFLEQAGKEHSG